MNNIKLFLIRNYDSVEKASRIIGVTSNNVRNWCDNGGRNMLKHLPEISETCGATYAEIVEEVMIFEREGVE